METRAPVVAFGELLVRLSAPGSELLLQTPRLEVCIGGAEANVAVSLSKLGHTARMVGVIPDNGLGRAARDELRRHGVDTAGLVCGPGRMGLYFLTPGALRRAPEILYDRAGSAFALAPPDYIDWSAAFAGAGWFHLSGVTPAVGANAAEAALRAAEAARAHGLTVSFDCNYRSKLWKAWTGDGPAVLKRLLGLADVLFADHRDIALILDRSFPGTVDEARTAAAKAVFETFPRIRYMACTQRAQHSVDRHDLTGLLFGRDGFWSTEVLPMERIVDRIGGGDAFAAGLIHGLSGGWPPQRSLDFALAAAGVKHAIPGDFNLASEGEILAALAADGLDVRR